MRSSATGLPDTGDSLDAPHSVRFCSRCGGEMHTGSFQGKPRRICTECRFIHFVEPKVAVAAMVICEARLLLVERAVDPQKGKWSLPAGYLDVGERPEAAVVREVHEETALEVEVTQLVNAYYNPPGMGAAVTLVYAAQIRGGVLLAGDDAAEAEFCALDALPELAFESTADVAQRAREALVPR